MSHPDPSVDYEDAVCTCGDLAGEHVDGEGACVIVDCGCKEFNNPKEDTI